jgi:hypothetical protein
MQIKDCLRNGLLMVVSALTMLIVLELILWLTPLKVFVPFLAQPRPYYVASDERGFDIGFSQATTSHVFTDGSFSVWSNELGCFDMSYSNEESIYVTGDSFAWGFSDFDDKWGTLLEKKIGTRVLKCGVDGYGTKQELLKAREIIGRLEKKPNRIIVSYLGANDVDDDLAFPHYTVIDGYRVPIYQGVATATPLARFKRFMTAHSGLYNMSKNSIRNVFSRQAPVATSTTGYTEAQYKNNFKNIYGFIGLATTTNASLTIVLVPSKAELVAGQTTYNNELKKYLQAFPAVQVIDLYPDFKAHFDRGEQLYWKKDGHWNEAGNKLAAELIARAISPNSHQD